MRLLLVGAFTKYWLELQSDHNLLYDYRVQRPDWPQQTVGTIYITFTLTSQGQWPIYVLVLSAVVIPLYYLFTHLQVFLKV